MRYPLKINQVNFMRSTVSVITGAVFFMSTLAQSALAYTAVPMQVPSYQTMLSTTNSFMPILVRGVTIDPQKPFRFEFIVQTGENNQSNEKELTEQTMDIVRYFMAGLTIPEKDKWVNLSPYEEDRMIPLELSQTQMGRDMLAQDYILKQLTSSLIHPDHEVGKQFWSKVYAKTFEQYGTIEIPLETFHKIWIVPNEAEVFVKDNTAFVIGATLKVMLEKDYLAESKAKELVNAIDRTEQEDSFSTQIMSEVVIPMIEEEVNSGKLFAPLRQMYHAMILAEWYKRNLQHALVNQIYSDQNKVSGITLDEDVYKEEIYEEYVQAYKEGLYSIIREEVFSGEIIPRKYFSGGLGLQINSIQVFTPQSKASIQTRFLQSVGQDDGLKFVMDFQEPEQVVDKLRIQLKQAVEQSDSPDEAMTAAQQFIQKVENPFWTNMKYRLRRKEKFMLDYDRKLIEELINKPVRITHGWDSFDLLTEEKSFYHTRIANSEIKGTPKGGIRWVTARDLYNDEVFREQFDQLLDLNPTREQVQQFIASWFDGEAKALALGMTLKTAGLDLSLGGAKGAVFAADIVEGQDGRWELQDWDWKNLQSDIVYNLASRHGEILAEAGAVGMGIDSPAPDIMTGGFPVMEIMNEAYLKVLVSKGINSFTYGGKVYRALFNRLKNVSDTYSIYDKMAFPLLTEMMSYWKEQEARGEHEPLPWIGVYTGKGIAYGGVVDRPQATGEGVVDVIMFDYASEKDTHMGKTVAIQALGKVGFYAARAAAREGMKVKAFTEYRIALYKPDGEWTLEELENIHSLQIKLKKSIYELWAEGYINPEGVLAKIVDDSNVKQNSAHDEVRDFLFSLDVDVLIPAFKEGQITETNAGKIKAKRIYEGANGPTEPVAEKSLFERNDPVNVRPDTLVNSGGVGVSGLEMEQANMGDHLNSEQVTRERKTMLARAVENTKKYKTDAITYRHAFDLLALHNLAQKKMQDNIIKYNGVLHRIRLEYEPEVTPEIILNRINKLGLMGLWASTIEQAFEVEINRLKTYMLSNYHDYFVINDVEQEVNALKDWFNERYGKHHHRAYREISSLIRVLAGETVKEASTRLTYEPRYVVSFRERLINVIEMAQFEGRLKISDTLKDLLIDTLKGSVAELDDKAMSVTPVGGIDLNAGYIDMRELGENVVIDFPEINLDEAQSIQGLIPVLINVTPVNIPFLLGLKESDNSSLELAYAISQD